MFQAARRARADALAQGWRGRLAIRSVSVSTLLLVSFRRVARVWCWCTLCLASEVHLRECSCLLLLILLCPELPHRAEYYPNLCFTPSPSLLYSILDFFWRETIVEEYRKQTLFQGQVCESARPAVVCFQMQRKQCMPVVGWLRGYDTEVISLDLSPLRQPQ